jgi:uncharacterized protein with von Willebrand factor type A (vWA) domain
MLIDFFLKLKSHKLPVCIKEYLTLLEAMEVFFEVREVPGLSDARRCLYAPMPAAAPFCNTNAR